MALLLLLLLLLLLVSASSSAPTSFFVSPSGDDATGDGSFARPWATLSHAIASVRPLLPSMAADITVSLRGGTYPVPATVLLTPEDSGQNGFTVHYAAYADETPVLDGGVDVPGWAPSPSQGAAVWSAPLAVQTRQLWVGGSRVNESVALGVNLTSSNTALTPTGYLTNDAALLALVASSPAEQSAADVEFLYTSAGAQWQEARARVASWEVVPANTTVAAGAAGDAATTLTCPCVNITMAEPGFTLIRSKGYPETYPTALTNLLLALQPGQGYVSPSTGRAFYAPRASDNLTAPHAVTAAALDGPILALVGNRTAEPQPLAVHNVVIDGLTFAHATWLAPTTDGGYAPDQGGIGYAPADLPPPLAGHGTHPVPAAGLLLRTAHNVSVSGCTFARLGATGVAVEGGSQDVSVVGNTFVDLSCSAVRLGEVLDVDEADPARLNARLTLADNFMFGLAVEFRDCSGIFGGFVVGASVESNTMLNTSWAGLTLGWLGWGGAPVRPSLGGNNITANRIAYVNLVTGDGGPIYVMAPQPATPGCAPLDLSCRSVMARNYVSFAVHHAALLYHDEGSAFWHTHDNAVLQPALSDPHGWWWSWAAAWASSEYDILIEENWAVGVNRSDIYEGNNLTLANNTLLQWGSAWPPAAQAVIDASGVRPGRGTADLAAARRVAAARSRAAEAEAEAEAAEGESSSSPSPSPPSSQTYTPSSSTLNATDFSLWIAREAASGLAQTLILAPGTYTIPSPASPPSPAAHLVFPSGLRGPLSIVLDGVTLLLGNRRAGALYLSNWTGVTLSGPSAVRYLEPPSNAARITAVRPGATPPQFVVVVPPGFPVDDFANGLVTSCDAFDPTTRLMKRATWDIEVVSVTPTILPPPPSSSSGAAAGQSPSPAALPAFTLAVSNVGQLLNVDAGDLLGCRVSGGQMTFHLDGAENCSVANVALFGGPCFGFFMTGGPEEGFRGGNAFTNISIRFPDPPAGADPGDRPLLSTSADGFHCARVPVGPRIANAYFEGMNDDGIAIHGGFALVTSADPATSSVVIAANGGAVPNVAVGEEVALYDTAFAPQPQALVVPPAYARVLYAVDSITVMPASYAPPFNKSTSMPNQKLGPGETTFLNLTLSLVGGGATPFPAAATFDWVVANVGRAGDGFSITDTVIQNHRARGMLIKASKGVISGNTVANSSLGGIIVTPELWWGEADYAHDLLIANNTVDGVARALQGYGGIVVAAVDGLGRRAGTGGGVGGHGNVTVAGNRVVDVGYAPLWLTAAGGVVLVNNTVRNPFPAPPNTPPGSPDAIPTCCEPVPNFVAVFVDAVQGLNASGNCVVVGENSSLLDVFNATATVTGSFAGGVVECTAEEG